MKKIKLKIRFLSGMLAIIFATGTITGIPSVSATEADTEVVGEVTEETTQTDTEDATIEDCTSADNDSIDMTNISIEDVTVSQDDLLGISCNYTLTGNTANYTCLATPVALHGKLSVSGTNLIDKNGKAVQLRGVSLHGIQHAFWENGVGTRFKDYVNLDSFKILRDEWGVNLIRIPVYTEEGGYCQGKKADMDVTIQNAVNYATQLGMYVMIDWHILGDGNPQTHQTEATTFFQTYASKYAGYNNVLYEICNEPNGVDWGTIKSYATTIIRTIRSVNTDAIIIVGNPDWSQLPQDSSKCVQNNPIRQSDIGGSGSALAANVMYTIHFYAATHKDNIRNNVVAAHNAGLPIFCTEFSICDASGNGGLDTTEAAKWMSLLDQYNISFCYWNLSNNNQTSSIFRTNCKKLNGWTNGDLTDAGAWFINTIRPKYDLEMATSTPEPAPPTSDSQSMYRLYNPNSGEHFYTAVSAERNHLITVGWNYEGIAWYAPKTGDPVYRLYNPNAGDHHYTTSVSEKNHLVSVGWNDEGISWYSGGSTPLYRAYNPNAIAGSHHYTTNKNEIDYLVRVGWHNENIAWYGIQ